LESLSHNKSIWNTLCRGLSSFCRLKLTQGNHEEYYKRYLFRVKSSVNRILIMGPSGITTCDPDGKSIKSFCSSEYTLTSFPCWSPLCDKITFAAKVNGQPNVIVCNAHTGEEYSSVPVNEKPIYLSWSPDNLALSMLRPHYNTLALDVYQLNEKCELVRTDDDTIIYAHPCFYTFSVDPEETHMLVYIDQQLKIFDYTTKTELYDVVATDHTLGFFIPYWTPDKKIVCLLRKGTNTSLVLLDYGNELETKQHPKKIKSFPIFRTILTRQYPGMNFILSKTGRYILSISSHLAIHDLTDPSCATKNFRDIFGHKEYARESIICAFLSPDEKILLSLHRLNMINRYWRTYDLSTGAHVMYDQHLRSSLFEQNCLRFFEQFNMSITLFSPDSQSFVYASGETIFVQKIGVNISPIPIGPGRAAVWSWK